MTLITTNTSSNAASSSFTSSIDSTYKLYIFKFYDVNPATGTPFFTFNGSIDGGSNYNVTKTTTWFNTHHQEADGNEGIDYESGYDLAQSTAFHKLTADSGNGSDESSAGELWLFNPSDTTCVKHFTSRFSNYYGTQDGANDVLTGGYFNTTDNIDAVQYKMSSGNMDAVIKMYGVG